MKKYLAVGMLFGIMISSMLCGCISEPDEISAVPEISYLTEDTERDAAIMLLLENYMTALTEHDHSAVTLYSTEDFIWNYNETGFLNYSRDIISAKITTLHSDQITMDGDIMNVPAAFEIEYKDIHTLDNGEEAPAGTYPYNCNFALKQTDEGYLIKSISNAPMG